MANERAQRPPRNLVAPRRLSRDFFFFFIDGSWRRIIGFFSLAFVALNLLFAGLFLLDPESIVGARPGNLADAFSFSIQTMSSIGYGVLSPGNAYGNALVGIEAGVSMIALAVATGFVVAKATRARARVMFSEVFTIRTINGQRVLSFRCGNARANEVVHARIKVTALIDEVTDEGDSFRRLRNLELQRDESPVFSLSWTVMHTLDETSPLYDYDWSNDEGALRRLIVTMHAHDGTYGQAIHARYDYEPSDARVDHRFVDVLNEQSDGRLWVDYDRFDDTEPLATRK